MGWKEVADAVVRRRVELGMRTREQFVDEAQLSRKTLGEIERNERASYDPATLATVESTLQWPYGTIMGLASGDLMLRPGSTVPIPVSRRPASDTALVEAVSAQPSDDELITMIRMHLGDLPDPQRQQFRDMLQRNVEWGVWARQTADLVAEALGDAVSPPPPELPARVTPDRPARAKVG